MKRFLTAKGLLGAALVIAMVLVAIVAPLVIPADYGTRMTMTARLRPPSELHWLGTDQLGRDLFYRVMLGARTSLGIAGAAVLMSLVLGLPIGMAAGFYRGGIDNALMRLVDTLLSFPVLLLVTFRPEFDPPWLGRPHVTSLGINRLAQRDVDVLIREGRIAAVGEGLASQSPTASPWRRS